MPNKSDFKEFRPVLYLHKAEVAKWGGREATKVLIYDILERYCNEEHFDLQGLEEGRLDETVEVDKAIARLSRRRVIK